MTEYEECPHGRHRGAYCEPCAEKIVEDMAINVLLKAQNNLAESRLQEYVDGIDTSQEPVEKQEQSGLDAPYYDFPDNIHSAMDLIEWLSLDFAQGNVLKSIIRENNPNAKKKTSPIYEAEKQYYYTERRLRNLRKETTPGD